MLWDAILVPLRPAIAAIIAELEARLGQTSAKSLKPPSSDGPHVNPPPPKPPGGKRRGG